MNRLKRLFPPFISFDDPQCKQQIPHSLEIINDAVLYISGEVQNAPKRYPFCNKLKHEEIECILSVYILNRLLNRSDNNWIRNYLLGSIEYCLLSSSALNNSEIKADTNNSLGLIANVSFLNSFITVFLTQYKEIKSRVWINTNDILLIILLRILDLLLAGCKNDKEKQQRMKQLKSTDKLMERLCAICNYKKRKSARNMIVKFIRFHHSFLMDGLFQICLNKMNKYYGMIEILLSILSDPKAKEMQQLFDDKYRKSLASVILTDIISTKCAPALRVRESFGLYFCQIKAAEFKDIFWSELERMTKRNCAETMKTLMVIFRHIKNLGSGDIHRAISALLMNELCNKESERRMVALDTFKLYTKHILHVSDISLVIESLCKAARGSGSSATAEERQLFVVCFEHFHKHCEQQLDNDGYNRIVGKTFVDSLISILNKEKNEAVRISILNIMNQIVCCLNEIQVAIPSSVYKMLMQCLMGKCCGHKTVPATIDILVNVLQNKKSDNNKEAFIKDVTSNAAITKLLNECIKKGKSNPKKNGKNALAAILCILYVNDELFKQHKTLIVNIINEYKTRSFFNDYGYIWSDDADVCMLRLRIIEKLLCKSAQFYILQYDVLQDASNFKGVWDCLLYCALHCDYKVRRYSCNVIKQINSMDLKIVQSKTKKKGISFSCLMVNLLHKYVTDLLAQNACYMFAEKVKSGELRAYEDIPLPIALSDCLQCIAGDAPHKDSIVYILYLSHYEWFKMQSKCNLWSTNIIRRWRRNMSKHDLNQVLNQTIHNNKQFEDLIRSDLTRIKYPIAQKAIMDTIASVFKLNPKLITENGRILTTVDHALNSGVDILDFTEKEKQICCTPEGVLCTFDDEHKSRSESEKQSPKKRKRNKKPTNIGGKSGGKNKAKGKKQATDKLLVKKVREKGTKRLITDEEWEQEQRKEIAIKTGAAEKEKQNLIQQQAQIRKKLSTVRFRLNSVFSLFKVLIAINAKDFASYLSLKYLKHIMPLSESQLLKELICEGVNIILHSFCVPIQKQSKTIALLLIKHHIHKQKLLDTASVRSLIARTIGRLKKDSKVPDIKVTVAGLSMRKRKKQHKLLQQRHQISARGRGRSEARGRARGRGRGRGLAARGRGSARGRARGRGRGSGRARGRGRGRGRGSVTAVAPDTHAIDEKEEDKEAQEEQLFNGTYNISNRWSIASFVVLFPLLQSCLIDVLDVKKKGNKLKYKINKLLPNWILSIIIHHCHDTLNIGRSSLVQFPCYDVSLLLLKCIDYYPMYCKALVYGLCQLSGSIREKEQRDLEEENKEEERNENETKYDLIKKRIQKTQMRAILHHDGCLSKNVECRKAALLALCENECILYPQSDLVQSRVWILSHDVNKAQGDFIKNRATRLWKDGEFVVNERLLEEIVFCLGSPAAEVRKSLALSLGSFCQQDIKSMRNETIRELIASYKSHGDEYIMMKKGNKKQTKISKWTFRDGVSLSLAAIARIKDLSKHYVMMIFDFILRYGLYDPDHNVYKQNLECGRSLFEAHGSIYCSEFFDKLEHALARVANDSNVESDWIRQGNVIFAACLVEQLEYDAADAATNKRVERAMDRLLDIIVTPNYDVQYAVCDSLQHLIKRENIRARARKYSNKLLHLLTTSPLLAARRGCAMGIASMVKGLKIPSVSSLGIMDFLARAVNNKNQWIARHGALLAYRELFTVLGTAFEPFVIRVLPHLLTRFGDDNNDVRKATAAASKAVMKNLSNFGIKMVLPLVLVALDKNDWRTKVQSSQMLGQMAYCAPKVLTTYLPQIIPKLSIVIQDPKKEVSSSAAAALKNIGSVVRNPEIASLVPLLIESITRGGGEYTKRALSALINTSFTNVVDVPSLALIIPILTSAMSDRSSATKKMAAQVIGGICSLIAEPKSIIPYLSQLLCGIRTILIDPIPEVRSASALAIRSLSESIQDIESVESEMCAIYEWLMTLLNDESTNNVQRFGAAQGLSELLASYHSDDKIFETLPIILSGLKSRNAHVRESFCQVFVYLPKALGADFPFWMEQVIPPLLVLLGDEAEAVRSCCLKGLKIIVFMFHETEYDLLLELLEEGLSYYDYRVRDATLILIGDLLNGLAGNEGSVSYETNANSQTEGKILAALGEQRRNEVFSLMYMARSDPEQPVRSRANITWKGLVYNSAKMLKAILDTLMHALITALSSKNRERQEAASKSLGDLVANAGQFIIPKIIPILKRGLINTNNDTTYKEGIALGLAQVLDNAHPKLCENYQKDIIDSIAIGICDKLPRVRNGCGQAFNVAVEIFGRQCVNQIVPNLCVSPVDKLHIDGLKQLLLSSSNTQAIQQNILSYLINQVLCTNEELCAISLLSKDIAQYCAPQYLNKYMRDIFHTLCCCIYRDMKKLSFGEKIIVDICPSASASTHLLLTTMTQYIVSDPDDDDEYVIIALLLLSAFVTKTRNDFDDNYAQLISSVLQLFNNDNDELRMVAWKTLNDIMSTISDEECAKHIECFRNCLFDISNNPIKRSKILGFCCKSGLKPVMRMFDFGIRNGSFEERAAAAKLMMDLVQVSNLDSVKPFLNKIAGALIRICADRFPSNVKCAILQTLSLLINKYGKLMKGFYTPLQTTFVKVIHDPSRDVRRDASDAILELMHFSPKFDNLLRDLNNLLKDKANHDNGVTISVLSIMSNVLSLIGAKVKKNILDDIAATFTKTDDFRSEKDDSLRFAASKCIASMIHCISDKEEQTELIVNLLDIDQDDDDWRSIEYDLNSLAFIISNKYVYNLEIHNLYANDILNTFKILLESKHVLVQIAAARNGYNFVARIAAFKFENSLEEILNILEKHLLPLLSPKVNNNKEDIIISSLEFLLEAMQFKTGCNQDEDEEEEKEEENNDYIWLNSQIHQLIIPYLIENHLNNIQAALMRKCIVQLLNINAQQLDLTHYNTFIENCNHKNVVKELTLIINAIAKTSY